MHKKSRNQVKASFSGKAMNFRAADDMKPVYRFCASCEFDLSGLFSSDVLETDDFHQKAQELPEIKFYSTVLKVTKFIREYKRQKLLVQGITLGRIEESSPRIVGGLITREYLELGGLSFPDQHKLESEDIPPMLWRTLVANRTPTGSKAPEIYRRILSYCLDVSEEGDLDTRTIRRSREAPTISLRKPRETRKSHLSRARRSRETIASPVRSISSEVSDESEEDQESKTNAGIMDEFLLAVHQVTYNRKLFRARNDELLGLAPASASVGDTVCILFGCSVPVILRERLSGIPGIKPYFELIGECYVDGVMEGEAIFGLGKNELKAQTVEFELR
jgi:hypothetical protein